MGISFVRVSVSELVLGSLCPRKVKDAGTLIDEPTLESREGTERPGWWKVVLGLRCCRGREDSGRGWGGGGGVESARGGGVHWAGARFGAGVLLTKTQLLVAMLCSCRKGSR